MVGSRLEDILLADFGTLERTLNANGFGKPRKLPNGFVVYQVRHPDDDLHIPGAYFGARKKSGSTCVESVVFGCADSLEAAVQSISGLPGAYKHESQRGGRMTLGAMSLSLAALLAGMSPVVLGGGVWGVPLGVMLGLATYALLPALVDYASQLARPPFNKGHSYLKASGLANAFQGREAVSAMLELTEIYRAVKD